VDIDCEGNQLAKKLASPGSQLPMELETVRRIKHATKRIFTAFRVLLPGRGILTEYDELEADLIATIPPS